MNVSRDSLAALLLFALFTSYGIEATQIDLFPGQEFEPFKPRTFPYGIALAGMALAAIRVLQTFRKGEAHDAAVPTYDRKRVAILCIVMVGYGALFVPLGFILATTLFLLASFYTLGERRPTLLVVLPLSFTLLFWAVMTQLLGLYLAPGDWIRGIIG